MMGTFDEIRADATITQRRASHKVYVTDTPSVEYALVMASFQSDEYAAQERP